MLGADKGARGKRGAGVPRPGGLLPERGGDARVQRDERAREAGREREPGPLRDGVLPQRDAADARLDQHDRREPRGPQPARALRPAPHADAARARRDRHLRDDVQLLCAPDDADRGGHHRLVPPARPHRAHRLHLPQGEAHQARDLRHALLPRRHHPRLRPALHPLLVRFRSRIYLFLLQQWEQQRWQHQHVHIPL